MTTTAVRDPKTGRFQSSKKTTRKAAVKVAVPAPKAKAVTRGNTRKPVAAKAKAPVVDERAVARAERIQSLAAGLNKQQAKAALVRATLDLERIKRTGEPGYVKAAARLSTAQKVYDTVVARRAERTVEESLAESLGTAVRSRRARQAASV